MDVRGKVADRSTLAEAFDSRSNSFTLLRLCLAFEVLAYHAHVLPGVGGAWVPERFEYFVGSVGVDGFFTLSGFLICRSWVQRPEVRRFLAARARRILPGMWLCLLVTVVVFVPLGAGDATFGDRLAYVVDSARFSYRGPIGSTLLTNPIHAWNGCLWSLRYEVLCYLGVVALGTATALRRTALPVAVTAWGVAVVAQFDGVSTTGGGIVPLTIRCVLMFSVGGLFFFHAHRVPIHRILAAAAAGVLLLAAAFTPDYRTVAAPALAYVLLYVGVTVRRPLKHDLSYGVYLYGFPVQQLLVFAGLGQVGWPLFFAASVGCVLPFALASWFLVERPAMKWRRPQVAGLLSRCRRTAAAAAGSGHCSAE